MAPGRSGHPDPDLRLVPAQDGQRRCNRSTRGICDLNYGKRACPGVIEPARSLRARTRQEQRSGMPSENRSSSAEHPRLLQQILRCIVEIAARDRAEILGETRQTQPRCEKRTRRGADENVSLRYVLFSVLIADASNDRTRNRGDSSCQRGDGGAGFKK